jgi:hypothetical protein
MIEQAMAKAKQLSAAREMAQQSKMVRANCLAEHEQVNRANDKTKPS